jgi:hypothetical protein
MKRAETSLRRSKPRPSRPRRTTAAERRAQLAWYTAITKDGRGRTRPCAACGRTRDERNRKLTIQGHHVIRQQSLRSYAATHGLDPITLVWDVRIGMAVCTDCHEPHSNGSRRLPRWAVPSAAWKLARELVPPIDWMIEREYPA